MNKANFFVWYLIISSLIKRFFSKVQIQNKQKSVKEIAILRIDIIGDYIFFRNFLKEVRISNKYKDCRITLIANKIYKDLAENFDAGFVDEFIWLEVPKHGDIDAYKRELSKIKSLHFDLLVVPQHSRTEWCNLLVLSIQAFEKIGSSYHEKIRDLKNKLTLKGFDRFISIPPNTIWEFDNNLSFFSQLLETNIKLERPIVEINPDHDHDLGDYILIGPGSSDPRKNWPLENYYLLIEKILETTKLKVVLIGGKSELELASLIEQHFTNTRIYNLTGKTSLVELSSYIRLSKLLISNDTGIIHIATALKTPSICFLGGGHYGRFLPYSNSSDDLASPLIINYDMECYNCLWICKFQMQENEPFPCIKNIEFKNAWTSVKTVLQKLNLVEVNF